MLRKNLIKFLSILTIYVIMCVFENLAQSSKIQSFVKKPVETKVRLGDTVTLECSVSDRHGDVQWIHEGTALGYDRQVPGRPRYSVKWINNEDTEYHLQITNVTLDDEGLFSCQVAPIGDWDTKLEEKAKLIVLVGPANGPEMMFNDESKNNNEIVHFKSSSEKVTKFSCTIRRSKPAATIKWFLNDTLIDDKNVSIGKATPIKQIVDGGHEDLTSVFELKQKTPLVYNNSIIRCQVYHDAFGPKTELKNMSISLRIVVVYAPSIPVITGYDASIGIIAGSELKLNCSSKYTYPSAMLSWYRGGLLISKNYDTIELEKRTESIYVIEKVSSKDNKAFFKCDAINQAMDVPISSNTTLNVLFGPDKLNMSGVFEVEVGKTISAVCTTEPANPSPKLIFNFGGIDFEPSSMASTPTADAVAVGAFIVNGSFSHVVNKEHNNKELKCIVENKAANIHQIVTNLVKVLYPPDSLEMTLKFVNGMLNEGTRIQIFCKSSGGNPLPEIEWNMNSKKLTPVSTHSVVYTISSTLDIVLGREHHNQSLTCQSTNKVGSLKKEVSFNVSYLPTNVIISVVEPAINITQPLANVTVKAGTRVVFSCRSPNSNPQPLITWFKDSYPILFNSDEQQNITSTLVNGKEYDTISYMSFIATSSDHLKEIRCDVKVRDLPRVMHGSLTLEVKFAPEIIKYPASIIDANENSTFSLNLTSRANPAPTYKCTANNKKNYTVTNGALNFTTSRSDNSDFVCLISNSENNTGVSFKLNVKYEPVAKINSTQVITKEGDQVQIYCIIDANPLESSHIYWQSNNKSLTNTDTKQYYSNKFLPPNLSILTILSARDIDDGEISCHVNNKIGKTVKAITELRVKRAPQILTDTSILKAGQDSNKGQSAFFQCKAQAYPDVTFKWKSPSGNNNEITNTTNPLKYVISNTKLENQIFMSMLTIYSVTSGDYGIYICEAKNALGNPFAKAVLSGKHQPEQPNEFSVTNITKNSISLAWKKNFDGGEPQRFRIRFRKDTIDPTYRYIETDLDATSLILDNLEPATRYVINIQSFNNFGTEGFLREPLIVQTDYGFNEINQMQIFTGNDLPLTIILVICGSGTIFMLFNIAFIVYLIKKRKLKGEADSTTDTNETDAANTVEMFSPPPPYPDELNYQFDLNTSSYEEENKPFVPHFHHSRTNSSMNLNHQMASNKYLKELNDQLDYAIEYATPINQWPNEQQNECDEDVYLSSLRQLDKNIAAAIAGVAPNNNGHSNKTTIRSSFNPNKRLSYINNANNNNNNHGSRPFGSSSNSFHQNLNSISSSFGDNYSTNTRAFPYDRLGSQARITSINSNKNLNNSPSIAPSTTRTLISNGIQNYRGNSTCKIYQDLDDIRNQTNEFKGHLV